MHHLLLLYYFPLLLFCVGNLRRASSKATSDSHRGGMGYSIVHQQHIPSVESENLFRHVASPKTVSVIG